MRTYITMLWKHKLIIDKDSHNLNINSPLRINVNHFINSRKRLKRKESHLGVCQFHFDFERIKIHFCVITTPFRSSLDTFREALLLCKMFQVINIISFLQKGETVWGKDFYRPMSNTVEYTIAMNLGIYLFWWLQIWEEKNWKLFIWMNLVKLCKMSVLHTHSVNSPS